MLSARYVERRPPFIGAVLLRMEASMLYVIGMIVVVTLAIGLLLYDLRIDRPR